MLVKIVLKSIKYTTKTRSRVTEAQISNGTLWVKQKTPESIYPLQWYGHAWRYPCHNQTHFGCRQHHCPEKSVRKTQALKWSIPLAISTVLAAKTPSPYPLDDTEALHKSDSALLTQWPRYNSREEDIWVPQSLMQQKMIESWQPHATKTLGAPWKPRAHQRCQADPTVEA